MVCRCAETNCAGWVMVCNDPQSKATHRLVNGFDDGDRIEWLLPVLFGGPAGARRTLMMHRVVRVEKLTGREALDRAMYLDEVES